MQTLDEIALECGTDKASNVHNYTSIYELYFETIRNKKIRILEIGYFKGSSSKLWQRYFPNAEIHYIELDPSCSKLEKGRAIIHIGDQVDVTFLRNIGENFGPFDLIIDDGGHNTDQQTISFSVLFQYVTSKGLYVVEDSHCGYTEYFRGKNFNCGDNFNPTVEYFRGILDCIAIRRTMVPGNLIADKEKIVSKHPDLSPLEKTLFSIHFYRGIILAMKM